MPPTSPVLVIDPGHGGTAKVAGSSANNARGANGLLEKDLTLDLARRVRTALSEYNVVLTRDSDTNLGLEARAHVARDLAAAVFVSIHFNGADSTAVDGTEAFVAVNASPDSRLLAQALLGRLLPVTAVRDRGVKAEDFGVLLPSRHSGSTAATLIEVAFLSNPAQAARLAGDAYKQQLADAIAAGIRDMMNRSSGLGLSLGGAVGGGHATATCPLLSRHGPQTPNLALRWNVPPANFTTIDVLVHLHGYATLAPDAVLANKDSISGADLDNSARERPTLALIPRGHFFGGDDNNGYNFPALAGSGLADLIRFGLDEFATRHLQQPAGSLSRGRLILTAHSGGGAALLALLAQNDPDEVVLFDSLYQPADAASRWAVRRMLADASALPGQPRSEWTHSAGALRAIFTPGRKTTPANTQLHQDLWCALQVVSDAGLRDFLAKRFRVEQTTVNHGQIPVTFGPALLADAGADLTPTPSSLTAPARCPATPRVQSLDDEATRTVARFEAMLGAAEAKINAGLMPRLAFTAMQELEAAASQYQSAGSDHAAHRRRLQSAFAVIPPWLFDVNQSAIGQIEDASKRRRFLNLDWGKVKFPGNSGDGNEQPARELVAEMVRLVPERRVPRLIPFVSVDGVVADVPETNVKLFPAARDAFVSMRSAAAQTLSPEGVGIPLAIPGRRGAFRTEQDQADLSSRNANRAAVAGPRSAHRYGLAADLALSVPGLRVAEATTRPMSNIIAMYRSPIYKWMFLFAESFGWYPYGMEPWHWEYNPPGFPERFATLIAELRAAPAGQSLSARGRRNGFYLVRGN